VLVFYVEEVVLHLKGKLMGVAIRSTTSIGEPFYAGILIAIEDLVTGFARNPELPAEFRHGLAG